MLGTRGVDQHSLVGLVLNGGQHAARWRHCLVVAVGSASVAGDVEGMEKRSRLRSNERVSADGGFDAKGN